MQKRLITGACLLGALAATGCASTTADKQDEDAKASAPRSGDLVVGFDYPDDLDKVAEQAGLQGSKSGDLGAVADAVVASINADGGVGGRKIRLVKAGSDSPKTPADNAAAEQSACQAFTQDAKVEIAVSAAKERGDGFFRCLRKIDAPVLTDVGITDPMLDRNPNLFLPHSISLTRLAPAEVERLEQRGFLTPSSKVGIVAADLEPWKTVARDDFAAALKRAGIDVAAVETLDSDPQKAIAGGAAIVQRFKAAGVDRILSVAPEGLTIGVTILVGAKQQYAPRVAMTSNDFPYQLLQNLPPATLRGVIGLGWQPGSGDVNPGPGNPTAPAEKRCLDLLKAAGLGTTDVNTRYNQLVVCDFLLFLDAVGDRTKGQVDQTRFAAATQQLGTGFRSAMTFATDFGRRRDGVSAARDLSFDAGKKAFVYDDDAERPLG